MFDQLRDTRQTHWLAEAFSTLPVPVMPPAEAYQQLVRGSIEHVPLEQLADRILATSVVPYPPGIPMLMPGEATGVDDGPYLSYLRALAQWDRRFPGFAVTIPTASKTETAAATCNASKLDSHRGLSARDGAQSFASRRLLPRWLSSASACRHNRCVEPLHGSSCGVSRAGDSHAPNR